MRLGLATLAIAAAMGLLVTSAFAQETRKSPHKRLERTCETCHVATSFRDIRFDHEDTGFPLQGHHAVSNCLTCHNVEDFTQVDKTCASCHSDVHRGRAGATCERCHTAGGWGVFDAGEIHAGTNFPVMGRHLLLDCESCHPGMPEADFRRTPSECIACHQADYDGVSSPNHATSGFSTDCRMCHQLTAWTPANMSDHDQVFPIFSGEHKDRWSDCIECHTIPDNFRVFDCLSCHEHNQGDTDAHHIGMPGYDYTSSACLSCHPTGAASRFLEHDPLFFPIYSGNHNGEWTDCTSCHISDVPGDFSCIDCHAHAQVDTDPTHNGMPGYTYAGTSCYDCHPTGTAGRYVDHDVDFFPIFSGVHNNRWNDCATCHTVRGDNSIFSCIDCHEHNQTETDGHHSGMPDYTYTSAACYDCHPDGTKEEFLLHDAQLFPIYSGSHAGHWTDCASCHVSGSNAVFSCIDCHAHDPASTDPTHNGMPGYSYTGTSCLSCHPTGAAGAFLEHDASYFFIYSGKHNGRWDSCQTCHDTGNNAAFTCFNCHEHNQADANADHSQVADYVYESTACLDCHPDGND